MKDARRFAAPVASGGRSCRASSAAARAGGSFARRRAWCWARSRGGARSWAGRVRAVRRCSLSWRMAGRLRRRGTRSWSWAAVWCCGFGGRLRVEPGRRLPHLAVPPGDGHAALVRRAVGDGSQRAGRGPVGRELVRVREPAPDDAEGSGVRRGRLVHLGQAAGGGPVRGARRRGRESRAEPDGLAGAA